MLLPMERKAAACRPFTSNSALGLGASAATALVESVAVGRAAAAAVTEVVVALVLLAACVGAFLVAAGSVLALLLVLALATGFVSSKMSNCADMSVTPLYGVGAPAVLVPRRKTKCAT
jgi:hypothetical protein